MGNGLTKERRMQIKMCRECGDNDQGFCRKYFAWCRIVAKECMEDKENEKERLLKEGLIQPENKKKKRKSNKKTKDLNVDIVDDDLL
jgi:hypothetical protein